MFIFFRVIKSVMFSRCSCIFKVLTKIQTICSRSRTICTLTVVEQLEFRRVCLLAQLKHRRLFLFSQGFIASVRHLLHVRSDASKLNTDVTLIDKVFPHFLFKTLTYLSICSIYICLRRAI